MLLTLAHIFLIYRGGRVIRLNIFRLQIMPFSIGSILKAFGEYGRLILHGTFLHIKSAVKAILRRKRIFRFAGRNKLHILLSWLVSTRIRKPATNQLSGRNSIAVYSKGIGDTHSFGGGNRITILLHTCNNFRQIFHIHLFTSTKRNTVFRSFYLIAGRVHTE